MDKQHDNFWKPIDKELNRWARDGLKLPVWWRDDDAIEDTKQLHRLLELSADQSVPLALACVPMNLKPNLLRLLHGKQDISVILHGWSHENNSGTGRSPSEFPDAASSSQDIEKIRQGVKILSNAFSNQFVPVMAPPWHQMNNELIQRLPEAGIHTLSLLGARHARSDPNNLSRLNVHFSPIDYRNGPKLKKTDVIVHQILRSLVRRRMAAQQQGRFKRWMTSIQSTSRFADGIREIRADLRGNILVDSTEPFGIVTHHLDHDEEIWAFVHNWLRLLSRHPKVVFWTDLRSYEPIHNIRSLPTAE